jgi:sugar phosphate isomerase/epimerase
MSKRSGPGIDLTASAYTLSGSLVGAGVGEPSRWPFVDRVREAAEAGYTGIGLFEADYTAMRRNGLSDGQMLEVLGEHGVSVQEIEFLFDWCYEGARDQASAEMRENLYKMAEVFRPHHLSGGDVNPPEELPEFSIVAERFGGVCDRMAHLDVNVVFEFLPWTGVPDIKTASEIVERANRPNGGIILDAWHYFRGPSSINQVAEADPRSIMAIALCDAAPPVGDPIEDTTRRRLLPGQGTFDLVGLLVALRDRGVNAPISVEILSEQQALLSVRDAARLSFAATIEVLKQAGYVPA